MLHFLKSIIGFWFKAIHRQLILAFVLSTALLMLVFAHSLIRHEAGFLESRSVEQATALAHTLAVSSASWALADDVVGLQEVVLSVGNLSHLRYVLVFSPEGRVMASKRPEDVGRYADDPVSRRLIGATPRTQLLLQRTDLVDVAVPILAGQRLIGWARVGVDQQDKIANLQQAAYRGYALTFIGMWVALALAIFIAHGLTKGLRSLISTASQIQRGRRDVRAEINRRDEVGILARNFNSMLDSLAESERKLELLNKMYAAWTESSDAVVRERDENDLLRRVCAILAERVQFRLVWVGMLRQGTSDIDVVASSDPESRYLRRIKVSADAEVSEGRGPAGTAIREGQPRICNDFLNDPQTMPWRAAAMDEGYRAVASFPLIREGKCVGAISVYSGEVNFFSTDIVSLLRGLADDLSFALDKFSLEHRRRQAEAQVELAAKVFESSMEGIVITDAESNIVSVNRGFTEITDYADQEVIGKNPRVLASGRHDAAFYQAMWAAIKETGGWRGEVWNRRKGGEIYPEWLTISCVKDESGQVTNYIGIFADISERKMAEERIQHLAHFDALTDLPNRTLLRDRLEQAMVKAQRANEKVAVMFLDLDRFKSINDTLVHGIGDSLLQMVAQRLLDCVREQDTVSRQGGDEFIVILPDTDADGVAHVAQKMLLAISRPYLIERHDLRVTPSIGISIYPDDAHDIETLIKYADVAMYHAKDNGRNNYQFYTENMNASAYERLALENSLRSAMEYKEFLLYYQPQVELASGKIIGCEALIRWRHPELGLVSPANFIPVAEESGLIVSIGNWVLSEACRHHHAWRSAGISPSTVAVNLSAIQFRQGGLTETVARLLDEYDMPPQFLELELTESIIMQGVDSTLAMLQELSGLGLQLSIDDFGTGYSSLSYLKRFPIHKLKIDQSFVRDIVTDANDAAIVRTIIVMAHSLNLRVIAEGVETAEQVAFLREAGCDEAQGYYFGQPTPEEEFALLLKAGKPLGQ